MQTNWILEPIDFSLVKEFSNQLKISPRIIEILVRRECHTLDQVKAFIDPDAAEIYDPFQMRDMEKTVERIHQAIQNKELIWVFGDTDVDGYTSTAVMVLTLQHLGARVHYYIPDRMKNGYGLHRPVLDLAQESGATLMITVDGGVRFWDGARYAKELGIDLLVTDHHLVPDELPEAYSIVNPKRHDCPYPEKMLAGVGVSYKVARALLDRYDHTDYDDSELLALVALGSISDRVPLENENRTLVQLGLQAIRDNEHVGWQKLCQKASIHRRKITSIEITEKLVPLLSAGKVMAGVHFAVDLFMTTNEEEATWMIEQMSLDMDKWQQTREMAWSRIEPLLTDLEPKKLMIVNDPEIRAPLMGFCASRLVQSFQKPAVVIGYQNVVEARGPSGEFSFLDLFDYCADLLEKYGGHKPAAGCTVLEDKVDDFIARMEEYAAKHLATMNFHPTIVLECELKLTDFVPKFQDQIRLLEPFGQDNSTPIALVPRVPDLFLNVKLEEKALVGDQCIFYFDNPEQRQKVAEFIDRKQTFDFAVSFRINKSPNVFRFDILDIRQSPDN